MSTRNLSATVSQEVFRQFDQLCKDRGEKRSRAVENAMKLYLKAYNDALIAEGCRQTAMDDLALANAARNMSLSALAREI